MINHRLGTVALLAFFAPAPLFAAAGPLAFSVDEKTQSYTITEQGRPVLTYRFGEVPLPAGVQASHFSKGDTPYDGAYFTDGSRYGGERSDYIYPLYGFHGEPLTADYPKDHLHHRSLWWSWCEVRHNDKIGDLWAVCKIRAYPVKITKMEARADEAVLQAVNAWRYDDDPAAVVNETVTIRASKTTGMQGARSRTVDVDVRLEALVDGVAIAGRQKVDYGGYGGMTVRLNPEVKEFSIRAVHPNPDKWRGDDLAIVRKGDRSGSVRRRRLDGALRQVPGRRRRDTRLHDRHDVRVEGYAALSEQFPLLRLDLHLVGLSGEDDPPARKGQAARLQNPLCDL